MRWSGAARADSGPHLCGPGLATRWVCPPEPAWSGAVSAALRFVVVFGIEVERAERLEDAKLFAPLHILGEGGGHCVFLGFVAAGAAGFLDQVVVEGEIGCHVWSITQYSV